MMQFAAVQKQKQNRGYNMFNELMNKVVGPISDSLVIVKEAFARCNSEEEVILLKKVFQDMLNDEAELRKDQL